MPPASFIPLAESSGLIIEMTRALMRRVCQEAGAVLGARPHLKIGFNLTARHFADEEIVDDVRRIFKKSPLRLSQIVLEVTERQPIENLTETRRVIAALQGLGVKIAIDDVGTGHSGLSYMLKLGVDIIKIDKMFIDSLGTDRNSNTIIGDADRSGAEHAHGRDRGRRRKLRAGAAVCANSASARRRASCSRRRCRASAFLQLVETIDPIKAAASADSRSDAASLRSRGRASRRPWPNRSRQPA